MKSEWIVIKGELSTTATCPICSKSFYYYNKGQYQIDRANYCPNCGAKMKSTAPKEEEE